MRKFTLFLMSLVLTLGTATAQIVDGKQYRVKTTTGTGDAIYLNVGNTDVHETGPKGGVNVVEFAEDDNQIFTFEAANDSQFYLKSASGYYVKCWQWNVDGIADDKTALTFVQEGDNQYVIKWDGGFFKVEYVGDAYYPFCDAAYSASATWTLEEVAAEEPETPVVETFAVEAALFPAVEGDLTEIKGIRVEANQGPSLEALPTAWTLTNEAGVEFAMNIEWLYDYETVLIMVNPAITEAGTYTLTIPAASLKTDDGKECEAAEFSWTVVEVVEAVVTPVYHITAKDTNRGALYASAEEGYLSHCGATYSNYHHRDIAADANDPAQQFAFVEYEGGTYLYAVGANRFAAKDGQYIKLTEGPVATAVIADADVEGYKNILLNGENKLNFSGGYTYGTVANWEHADDGNRLLLTEVGELDLTELYASIEAYFAAEAEALAAARATFDAVYAEAGALLEEANLSVVRNELPLQTTDATAAAYIWCNNPEATEGPIANLVDGTASEASFFHTNWHGGGEEPHYIEVDLGEGNELAEFSFKYTTRFSVQNDYPDGIQVLGSNDKETYTEVYNVTNGLPQTGGTQWASNIISSETAYRYLRFVVTAERTYWHMSEFDIITTDITIAEKYAAWRASRESTAG